MGDNGSDDTWSVLWTPGPGGANGEPGRVYGRVRLSFRGSHRRRRPTNPTKWGWKGGPIRWGTLCTASLASQDRRSFKKGAALEHRTDLRRWNLAEVARRCTQETTRFFQGKDQDTRFCYELFRRALLERDDGAWELLYAQYSPLITGWVKRHPAFPASGEDGAYFVNRALEKFWAALPPERFSRFPDLSALLRYLQMCVHSTILDHVRRIERLAVCQLDDGVAVDNPAEVTAEDEIVQSAYREELWRQIDRRLHGEKERCVVYGSFVLALKPGELLARFPHTFRDVREVYGIKENVLARLSRDGELRKLLGPDA